MNRKTSEILAVVLVIVLVSVLFPQIQTGMVASAAGASESLIAGKMPTDFYRAVKATPQTDGGGNTYVAGYSNYSSYTYDNTATKATWEPFLSTATDSDESAGSAYNLKQSFVLIYELDSLSKLSGFSINFGLHDGNKTSAVIDVYTAKERSLIFSNSPVATADYNNSIGGYTSLNATAKYVAVVIKNRSADLNNEIWYFAIKNIAVYGSVLNNLASGLLPCAVYPVNSGTTSFSNRIVRAQTSAGWVVSNTSGVRYGYGDTPDTCPDNYKTAFGYFTDGSTSQYCHLAIQNIGTNPQNTDDIVLIYDLGEGSFISGISIDAGNQIQRDTKVYASDEYTSIFSNQVATYTSTGSDHGYSVDFNEMKKAQYVAFVFNAEHGVHQTIYELEINGYNMFKSHSLVLDDSIGVNFFMNLSDLTAEEKASSYMTFAITNGTAKTAVFNGRVIGTGSTYGFTCSLSSIQMAETITPTFHYTSGGSEKTVTGSGYSVKKYIDYVNGHTSEYTTEVVTLVNAIGNYGYYAQQYMSNKTSGSLTAGTDYTALAASYRTDTDYSGDYSTIKSNVSALQLTASTLTNGTGSGNYKQNLNLGSDITVLLRVYGNIPVDFGSPSMAGGNNFTKHTNYVSSPTAYNELQLRIPILKLNKLVTVNATINGSAHTITISGLSYVYSVLNSGSASSHAKNAVCALYDYYTAAAAYAAS